MMQRGSVNKLMVVSGVAVALAGGYFGVKSYKSRQQSLVDEFAATMMLYWGDAKASADTVKEFKGKIGLLINTFHKGDMFRAYAIALAQNKALSVNVSQHSTYACTQDSRSIQSLFSSERGQSSVFKSTVKKRNMKMLSM